MSLLSWIQNSKDSPEELAPGLAKRLEELAATPVKDVMIPRALVVALDADVQLRRVRRLKSSKTAYFAVYQGDLDHILGWISKQKVLELLNEPLDDVKLKDFVKPAGFVKEDDGVAMMADAFLKSSSPFLVVQNADQVTVGLLPLSEYVELVFGFELDPTSPSPGLETNSTSLRGFEA